MMQYSLLVYRQKTMISVLLIEYECSVIGSGQCPEPTAYGAYFVSKAEITGFYHSTDKTRT
jgi:hypothetical protein